MGQTGFNSLFIRLFCAFLSFTLILLTFMSDGAKDHLFHKYQRLIYW